MNNFAPRAAMILKVMVCMAARDKIYDESSVMDS